jgi:RNA polymerase sigma factor (sigma-70 family)
LRKHYAKRDDQKTSLDNPDFLTNHVTNPTHAGEYKDIEQALGSLPTQQSDVFKKVKIEGYTAKEVANEMGMSVSAVKVSAHRTMKRLKKILE